LRFFIDQHASEEPGFADEGVFGNYRYRDTPYYGEIEMRAFRANKKGINAEGFMVGYYLPVSKSSVFCGVCFANMFDVVEAFTTSADPRLRQHADAVISTTLPVIDRLLRNGRSGDLYPALLQLPDPDDGATKWFLGIRIDGYEDALSEPGPVLSDPRFAESFDQVLGVASVALHEWGSNQWEFSSKLLDQLVGPQRSKAEERFKQFSDVAEYTEQVLHVVRLLSGGG
jgi:hypothetical protein